MPKVQVFEPAMCCSTGVCGPSVDPVLVRFAADAEWLESQGVTVERNNLSSQPQAFVAQPLVQQTLRDFGTACLPLTLMDGEIAFQGRYPSREELVERAGLTPAAPPASIFSERVAELVAIGAAIVANSESAFRYHYDRARKMGISKEDMWGAVAAAQSVKEQLSGQVLQTAARYLNPQALQQSSGCYGTSDDLPMVRSNGCC